MSRNLTLDSNFRKSLKSKGIELLAKSLIQLKPIEVKSLPESDWIFFSSSNAVNIFFELGLEIRNRKIGIVGPATERKLNIFGHQSHFVSGGNDTVLIGQKLKEVVGNEIVLFPGSEQTKGIIAKQLNQSQVINFPIYRTTEIKEVLPFCSTLIFTSPSNVRAYFSANKFLNQRVIAIGKTTAKELGSFGITKIDIAKESTEKCILGMV